jgi:hypothetical protein
MAFYEWEIVSRKSKARSLSRIKRRKILGILDPGTDVAVLLHCCGTRNTFHHFLSF